MGNFLESMRSRKKPMADIDAGFGHAMTTILANMSYRNGIRMEYDSQRMEIKKSPAVEMPATG